VTREQLLEGLQERMKKYEQMGLFPEMRNDLQATVRALEVAARFIESIGSVDPYGYLNGTGIVSDSRMTLLLMDQTLGKAGV